MTQPISRRALLGSALAAPAVVLANDRTEAVSPATFVFVPGTWHGGWAWTPLCEALRARGHRAFAVTCTGVGERSHLLTPEVGLDTHITDVSQVIECEELNNVVLCGHSFGGLTITGVADAMQERIAQLVFYDAFIPTPERPAWIMRDASGAWPDAWQKALAEDFIDGYKMNFFDNYPIEMLVPPEEFPDIVALLERRLTLHPAKQWMDPVSFDNGGWQNHHCSYVHCVGQTYRQSSVAMYGPAREFDWPFVESPTPRVGMLTHTELTADILESLLL